MGLCPTNGVSVLLSKWSDLRPYACRMRVLATPGCVMSVASVPAPHARFARPGQIESGGQGTRYVDSTT